MCLADRGIHKEVGVSRLKPEESCRQEGSRGSREDILLSMSQRSIAKRGTHASWSQMRGFLEGVHPSVGQGG